MDLVSFIIQLLSGAVGGTLAGDLLKNLSLGVLGNSLTGIVGGFLGGQLLQNLLGVRLVADDNVDLQSLFASVVGGGIGGAIVTAVVAWTMGAQQEGP
jgi:uncharacterized membrane protein YeaQ/YmgE (transglycosylase-associated protein family)